MSPQSHRSKEFVEFGDIFLMQPLHNSIVVINIDALSSSWKENITKCLNEPLTQIT